MSFRAPLRFEVLSEKGWAHAWLRHARIAQASPRMQQLSEPTYPLVNLNPEVVAWLAERRIKPTRIFAHEIEFRTAEEAIEFKVRWS
ncbi:MAG: hypothetical protein EOO77_16930 [Oxalobacteraceae bacterium]|nr:MAG: hypothetical protein EOO77_16930 [Oxalobacteraceae bacterium]